MSLESPRNQNERTQLFDQLVMKPFNLYNSLFLSLPFQNINKTGILLPLLQAHAQQGLDAGEEPMGIMERFFEKHTSFSSEEEKVAFMFQVIQYVERQIVLFDSVEDAAFKHTHSDGNLLSIHDFIHMIGVAKKSDALQQYFSEFSTRIVFTAHPTQFYPPSVLDIIQQLRNNISHNNIGQIDQAIQQLGLTSFSNRSQPTPFDEARNILYYLRHIYYDAMGEMFHLLKQLMQPNHFENAAIVKLGFWPGGDRDGNPFVTADITKKVADALRMTLMKCYYNDIKDLKRKLTFRDVEMKIAALQDAVYPTMFDPEKTISHQQIIEALTTMKSVIAEDYNGLYLDDIDRLIEKVMIFKSHFATLDIRQHHDMHRKTVEAILISEKLIEQSLDELKENELIHLLLHHQIANPLPENGSEIVLDTIRTIRQIADIQQTNGEEGCNRYIISNSEDIYAVLYVYALLHWCSQAGKPVAVDIIPLFESMDGMKNAPQIMQFLFENETYRKHLISRGDKQTIMLGFSDGTKDGGYLKANWSIYETKERLTAVCKKYDIKAIFFDGRGGPPARGGGKTHQFYASQGPQIANHEIQLTIQGQTISSRFGTSEHFKHNIEQLLTAALSQEFFGSHNVFSNDQRALMEELSSISFQKYTALKKHPRFISYLEKKSTLRYYSNANIGSRPAKRGKKDALTLNDLRAISFVGSWSQLKQNVPGYFGIGTALEQLANAGKMDELKALFSDVPYFKTLILNSMMSLSKSNFALTSYMARDNEFGEFWAILKDEYDRSVKMVLAISGYQKLMQEEQLTKKSIDIREQIVLPLLVIQQYALQMIEKNVGNKEVYEKMVTRSLYGNINASRNSA